MPDLSQLRTYISTCFIHRAALITLANEEQMPFLERLQAIQARHSSSFPRRIIGPNGACIGSSAIQHSLLRGQKLAPTGVEGQNAMGKTSMAEANTVDTMLTNDEYQELLKKTSLEPDAPLSEYIEENWQDVAEPCSSDGASLLAAGKYIAPTAIDMDIREGKLFPVMDAGHSTRAITASKYGLRLGVELSNVSRMLVKEATEYLSNINSQLRTGQSAQTAAAGGAKYDIPLLRRGLQLIRKSVSDTDRQSESSNAVLQTVRTLQPEEICIPLECWQKAGTVERFYTDPSKTLEEQLDELSEYLWRYTTCYEGETRTTGNQHLAYLDSVLVTLPSKWLQGIIVLDHVGYIYGDKAVEEAYSKLNLNASNIIALADSRSGTVNRALELLGKSRLLQQIVDGDPDTPHTLLLMSAEKTSELHEEGSKLNQALDDILQHGSADTLHTCLQQASSWLQQLARCEELSVPAVAQVASMQGTQKLAADQLLMWRLYKLLQARKRHELRWLVQPVMDTLRQQGWQGSQQSDLVEAGVVSLVWWPKTYSALKQTLQKHQQGMEPQAADQAKAILAEVIGIAAVQRFTQSGRVRWAGKQAAAALEAQDATQQQIEQDVPLIAAKVQTDIASFLKGDAGSDNATESERQRVLDALEALQTPGSCLCSDSLEDLQQLVCTAVKDRLQPHIEECTMERGLAEGIIMVLGEDFGPDLRDQLGLGAESPEGSVLSPAEYPDELVKTLTARRDFKSWLHCDHRGDFDRQNENIIRPPGQCVLLPMQQKTTLGLGEPFITLMVQQQTVQQQSRAVADIDDTCAARLKLGHIAAKLQAALQPSAAIASTSFGLELRLLQGRVPSMLIAAFEAVSDFDRLVYPTLMQTMAEELYRGITSSQVDAAKKMMRNKLLQLIKDYSKMKEAMLLEVDKKVIEVVEMCWQKLLYSVKTQIVDKVRLYVADQQHQQQQMKQTGGFSKAVSDLIELRMYMSGMNSRIWADAQLGPQQLLPATARREAGGSSSKAAFNQPLIPTAIAQLVLQGPDVFDDETLVAILPQTQHLRQLADRVMELLQQNGVPGSNYTLHQVQQEPALVKWCAEVLEVQLPDGISAADLVQLWLGALPAEATIDELARAASGESAARPSAGTQPGQQAGDGFAAHALDDAKVIGSELYMVLLMQLLKQDKLPWTLDKLRTIISPQLTKLTTDGALLPGQLISSLPPSERQQIAIELYLGCYRYDCKSVGIIQNQRMVDALVLPSRVSTETAAESVVSGSSRAALNAGSSSTAVGTRGTASSLLNSLPSNRLYSTSSGQQLLRVSARPLPQNRPGVRATHVRLPVSDSAGRTLGTVALNRDNEFLLAGTRVICRAAKGAAASNSVMQRLDAQASPVVLLAAAMVIQQQQQPQQQRASTPVHGSTTSRRHLWRASVQLWYDRMRAALQGIQEQRRSSSSSRAGDVPEDVPAYLQAERWEVIETMYGNARFFYTGPLPSSVTGSASSSSSSSYTVGFEDFKAALSFAQKGTLPQGMKYLRTEKQETLLRQLAKVVGKIPRPELAQQATSMAFAQQLAAPPPPPPPPAAAAAAAASGRRRTRKRAAVAAQATTASLQPAATTEGSSHAIPSEPAAKRSRMSGNRRLTIGEVVAATPKLQTDEPVNLILTPSTSTRRIVLAKLSTEGAMVKLLNEDGQEAACSESSRRQATAADSTRGTGSRWLGPFTNPCALIRKTLGVESCTWRNILNEDGTSWKDLKDAVEEQAARNKPRCSSDDEST